MGTPTEVEDDLDRAAMASLAAGRPDALDDLMQRHGPRLRSFLFRLLQREADAEDLAQETFVRVFQHRSRFDPRLRFHSWLYAIAANLVRDRFRWRTRHPERPAMGPWSSPTHPDGERWETDLEGVESAGRGRAEETPEEHLLRSERARAVQEAVALLPPELRVPLVLAEYEDLPHAEIAQVMGCSPKAVEVRLYRARRLLRQRLEKWLD
jgi:RNA polymerase sigma-70 factor (ECF subfamily)